MSPLPRFARLSAAILTLCLCAFTGVAGARTRVTGWRSPLTGVSAPSRPGQRDPAISSRELAAQFERTTGLSPSQVTLAKVCGPSTPGRAACEASAVVLRSSHQLVRPRHLPARHALTQVTPADGTAAPATNTGTSAPSPETPAWLQQAYDLSYLSQTGGVGTTVAIVDAYDDPTAESDLATFRSQWGLPACTTANGCFQKVNQSGQQSNYPATNTGWEGEESLDLDAVSSLCPHCHILLVEANSSYTSDLDTALQRAVSLGATIVSNSYAGVSTQPTGGTWTFPGVSVIASTGDTGYTGAGYAAYPAAYPGVTAAGGTNIAPTTTSASSARGFTEASWALNSSGSGAGAGCNLQEPKPAWQTDTGCTGRSYADLSADADPATGLWIYSTANGGWGLYGGTSLASPLIAAYEAVTGVNGSTPQWAYADGSLLNDPSTSVNGMTSGGNNGSCATNILYICNAGVGYDGPTGIGSISGDVVTGGPGIGGPSQGTGYQGSGSTTSAANTYTKLVSATTATLTGGVYPNGLDTTYHWEYGTTTSYGQQSSATDIGAGQHPVAVTDTLSGLSSGTTYHYRLVATNADGTTYGYDSTLMTASAGSVAPVNTALPAISGNATQGQTLSVTTGTWSPAPTSYSYQWQRSADGANWTNISGATSSSYALTAADIGDEVDVVVTATDSWGSTTATATQVGPVASAAPVNTAQPVISGNAKQGETVTVTSTWAPSGASLTYQWQRSPDGSTWTTIAGAASASYTLSVADEGDSLRVIVTASNGYGSATATSQPVGPVHSNPPVVSVNPTVTGSPQRTFQLTATQGTWSGPQNTYAYQWQRSADGTTWTNIAGAAGASYTLVAADEGDDVRVLVTASNADGLASAASNATTPIDSDPPQNNAAPTISGTAERSMTLSALQGAWSGPDNTYSYQWQRDAGDGYVDIQGATSTIYTLTTADEGNAVRVVVTASNPDGTIVQASQPSGTVQAAPPVNSAVPTVLGNALRGSTMTAGQGTWEGVGNTYAYQWQSSVDGTTWSDISGATGGSYTVGVPDEGNALRVKVTVTNLDGTATAVSQATGAVPSSPPVNTTAPSVLGTVQRSSVLAANIGVWSGIGNAYSYQWQRSADGTTWTNITGATGASYTVATADETDTLRLRVTATNPDGTVTANSQPTSTIPASPPVNTTAPTLSGNAQRGSMLSAAQGSWGGIGNGYTYQWQRSTDNGSTWTNVAGATSLTDSLGVADEGAELRLQVTATNPDGTVTAASAASGVVAASLPNNTVTPVITGTAQRGLLLTATQGTWAGLGNSYTLQWQRSANGTTWANITGATSATYTPAVADETDKLRLLVTATNPDGSISAVSAATATVTASNPVSTGVPTITGAIARASSLTATSGTWNGNGNTYTYQWQRSADGTTWTNIAGATNASYTVGAGDEGDKLQVVVTATNDDGTANATSAATTTVATAPPVNTAAPALSGTVQRGQPLTTTQGTWSGIGNSYTIQWQRNSGSGWTNITGQTGSSYTLGTTDETATVRAVVTATNDDGTATAATAASATVPAAGPVNTAAPALNGTAQRGQPLTATQGTWTGIGNSFTVQWQRSGDQGQTWTNITGATDYSYTLTVADEGDTVRAQVTASNPDGSVTVATAASNAVQASAPVNTVVPTISGPARRSSTLNSSQGTWTGNGNSYSVQWQRSTDNGTTWTDISGATNSSYVLAVADEGDLIRLNVTATNADGLVSVASAPSATVAGAPPVNTRVPSVTGTDIRNYTLTADEGSWTGVGNSYQTQWQRSADQGQTWTNIAAATTSTYQLVHADVGDQLRFLVTVTNTDGTASVASAPTTAVSADPPVNTAAPTVTGTLARSFTLTGTGGTWLGAGSTYAYQWQSSGDQGQTWTNISGATSLTYIAQKAVEGDNLRLMVTGTDPDGSSSVASAATAAIQAAPPVNTGLPSISGLAGQGQTLTAQTGTWTPDIAGYSYVWQRGDSTNGYTAIAGATTPTYTTTAADVGETVRVIVTATNPDGNVSATSAATNSVVGAPQSTTAPGAPSGTLQNTYTLTAAPGGWNQQNLTYAYAWVRCAASASAITSACTNLGTGSTYAVAAADVGFTIGYTVTATSIGGKTTASSALTAVITGRPLTNQSLPSISGNPQVTQTLNATAGAWSVPLSSVAYVWQRCDSSGANCQPIAGATSAGYVLTSADNGQTVRVIANVTSPGQTASATSAPVTVEAAPLPEMLSAPQVQGSPVRGVSLSASNGRWSNSPTGYAYVWERCDASGSNCQPIPGMTGQFYTLSGADEGQTITVKVTASNTAGSASATAQPIGPVASLAPIANGQPTIQSDSATLTEGAVLVMARPTWQTTSDTTYAAGWQRCDSSGGNCQAISGATGWQYTTTSADVGSTLRGVVTATNFDGHTAAVSAATNVVTAGGPRWRTLPTIGADPGKVGDVLGITGGTWTGPSLTSDTVQLQRCTNTCSADGTANVHSYTITSSDLGALLMLSETATNPGGSVTVWSPRYIGPIISAAAGAAVLGASQTAIRNTQGVTLATARETTTGATAAVLSTHLRKGRAIRRTVVLHRAGRVTGKLTAWACQVKLTSTGRPGPCTRKIRLTQTKTLRLPRKLSGRVRVVVVRSGR